MWIWIPLMSFSMVGQLVLSTRGYDRETGRSVAAAKAVKPETQAGFSFAHQTGKRLTDSVLGPTAVKISNHVVSSAQPLCMFFFLTPTNSNLLNLLADWLTDWILERRAKSQRVQRVQWRLVHKKSSRQPR